MIDTILFDFDGTIMNTNEVIIRSWQHTFKTLRGRKHPVEELYKNFGEPLELTVQKYFPEVPVDESVEVYRSYHRENFGKLITVFPGMKETLEILKGEGYKTALVTSRLKATTMEGLEAYELKHLFDGLVTADDCAKHKPDPEPINIALKKVDSKAEESIMIGDTKFDIMAAKNAGVKSVLVGWAVALDPEGLKDHEKPDHIIDEARDLLKILK